MEPKIIYEDKNFIAVNKPAGLLVHAVKLKTGPSKEPTLTDWVLKKYPEMRQVGDEPEWRPGVVHRLDKATSGVILMPRTQEYFLYLKSLFQSGQMKKTYLSLVFGELSPKTGKIEKPIGINNGTLKRSVRGGRMVKEAITVYEVEHLKKIEGETFSSLKVMPQTGRTHQIRVHLASLHHPVVGDKLYGPKKQPEWAKRLMLHALSIEWTEGGGRIKIEAVTPEDFIF